MSAHLYRLYDATDRLLYIGISKNARKRIAQHRRLSPFGKDIARHEVTDYPDRAAALAAEAEAIKTEGPIFNKAHYTPDYQPAAPVAENTVGDVIRVTREEMGLSAPQLAALAGVRMADLLEVERGGDPSSAAWQRAVTDALGQHLAGVR